MFEEEEKALNDKKNQLQALELPTAIDDFIRKGMEQGKIEKRKQSWFKPLKMTSMAAAILLFIVVASIRFSPSVAAYVGQIPALQSLVKLVTNDKGLKLALENEFIQPVGVSDEHDGVRFTVDGVIADESRVLIFYTLENMTGLPRVDLDNVLIKSASDDVLMNYGVSYGSSDFREEWSKKDGTIDVNLQEGSFIPNKLDLKIELKKYEEDNESKLPASWSVEIPIDTAKFQGMKEEYTINKSTVVEGQRITFNSMTVYPTRIGLDLSYDPSNTKKIFYFDDIELLDENGETFGTITNGTLASHVDDNRIVLYFQSNYFKQPKNIFIQASSMRALNKDLLLVEVDTEKKQLLKAPDNNLKLNNIGTSREGMIIDFTLTNKDPRDESRSYGVFSSIYHDARGNEFHSSMSGFSGLDGEQNIQYYIKDRKYANPIKLTIEDYPTRIKGNIHIKVK